MHTAIVGAGSNLGSREASIRAAALLLNARPEIAVIGTSPLYETPPLGPPQPDYLNAAFRLSTRLSPKHLLAVLLRTERRLGRKRRPAERWGPRSIDLDLLWDSRGEVNTEGLCVPHPGLTERAFALVPLLDVAPELTANYGEALEATGGGLSLYSGERDNTDSCAFAATEPDAAGRPWATCHRQMVDSPRTFAHTGEALRAGGFHTHCATISHCSEGQWVAHFHGANLGNPILKSPDVVEGQKDG